MKIRLLSSTVLATLIVGFTLTISGQIPDKRSLVGETLVYDGKISKLLRSWSIAELSFIASKARGSDDLLIKSEAVSKGTLLRLFRYSFIQQYESFIDLDRFRIKRTKKHDVQKTRVRDSEALFDYDHKRVIFVETDPKDAMRPPRRIASVITEPMHDMISAIYAVRVLPLSIGKRYEFSVSDSGLVYKVPFAVTGREMQKSVAGSHWCWRVEPEIFGPGRLIEQKGKMVLWMTDDGRHLPVKAEVTTPYGKVDIKLKSYKSGPRFGAADQ